MDPARRLGHRLQPDAQRRASLFCARPHPRCGPEPRPHRGPHRRGCPGLSDSRSATRGRNAHPGLRRPLGPRRALHLQLTQPLTFYVSRFTSSFRPMTAPIEPPSTAKDEIAAEQPEQLTARLKIGTRRPGLSLAAFPALLYSFLPYSLQARLTEGSVTHRVLSLAWPSVMEQSLLTLVGLVDAYIFGHLGAAAIAGVGLGGQVLNLTAALFSAVGVGATALIARHIGADEPDEANRLAGQALVLALAIGCLAALIAFIYAAPIMRLLGAAPEVVVDGAAWLRVVAPSFITVGALLVGTASLRGAGDTRTPLGVMIIVNLVNVAVAWTFTRGLFGLPNLGVVGSGLGAMSGQIIGGLAVVFIFLRGRGHLKLGWRFPAPDFARLRRIL